MYVVFEDKDDATETKIHDESKKCYQNRKLNAKTTKWHGPFDTYKEAEELAKQIASNKQHSWKDCEKCM